MDHRRICGPSLSETSLRGSYLYLIILSRRLVRTVRNVRTLPNVCHKMAGHAVFLTGHISHWKDVLRYRPAWQSQGSCYTAVSS